MVGLTIAEDGPGAPACPVDGTRILVTGAGGFVGRTLVALLRRRWPGSRLILLDSVLPDAPDQLCGDLRDPAVRQVALGDGMEIVFHLAAIPGGAAEGDSAASRAVNVDATLSLMEEAARARVGARFVYASTIAVFGQHLPPCVDDTTPPRPGSVYGAHKLMMEIALADLSRRGLLDGISLRLPAIVARPPGENGLKSAFLSQIVHRLAASEGFTSPVSATATFWLASVQCCAENLAHAGLVSTVGLPASRAVTLPACRVGMAELEAMAVGPVRYEPDAALQAAFGAYPPLQTPAAERLGFRHDGGVAAVIGRALGETPATAPSPVQEDRPPPAATRRAAGPTR